ncbi:MAG TPA: DEAD/DEAH box helicase, partial [Planctomycetota bacterium]|nr:DEAD/DEAH box helicase [Planctomycetota bacterium]
VGYPVEDVAGYAAGDTLAFESRPFDLSGTPFHFRDYQESAAQSFYAEGTDRGGAGVVVLPCGAGKTVVGIRSMELFQVQTLILTTNRSSVSQWRRELLQKTTLREDQVGEYTGDAKEICPVTISTYQILTWRKSQEDPFVHFDIFSRANWGLVIYDEVHLLPAPVFRVTAELQARRRLGLTATLVREDGKEDEVFSLIGPCRYELPWRVLEKRGFIAEARCVEVRVPLPKEQSLDYDMADQRHKIRIAAENPAKVGVVEALVKRHAADRILVIGQYTRQLHQLSRRLGAPIITGKTPNHEREVLYQAFRSGEAPILVVSKVANFAIDLPDANVAIQVSGTFGSRQEEAQRLGRVLRQKSDGSAAVFYALVTEGTRDQEFAAHRQLFLAEQGYSYEIRTVQQALLAESPLAARNS